MCDKVKIALLAALVMLPLSALLIHAHVHPTVEWVYWFVLFDAVAITGLYLYKKTVTSAFWLNTVFGLVGMIYHAQTSLFGTLSDSMLILADIAVGYVLYVYLSQSGFRPQKIRPRKFKRKRR